MTVREIARQAGVSAATVSRYFTGTEMGNRMGGACVSKVGCLSGYLTEEQLLREFQASNSSC